MQIVELSPQWSQPQQYPRWHDSYVSVVSLLILFDAVSLHQNGKAAVGVALKPPDESFRRLETALLTFGPKAWRWRHATAQPVT